MTQLDRRDFDQNYFADKPDLLATIFSRYPDSPQGKRSALMPLLREVQDAEGFVHESRMDEIASLIGTTATEVRSVDELLLHLPHPANRQISPSGLLDADVCAYRAATSCGITSLKR